MLELFMTYAAIWAPSLVAVLGVVATVVLALSKVKTAFQKLDTSEILSEVNKKLTKVTQENEELIRCNKLLLDQITKIQDYADQVTKEK